MNFKQLMSIIFLIFLLQLVFIPSMSNAQNIGDVVTEGDNWLNNAKVMVDQSKLKESQSFIYNALLVVGIIITVFWGGYIGIKFMYASAEDKADIKQTMIPYVVGCIVIYGGFAIWKLVITILDSM